MIRTAFGSPFARRCPSRHRNEPAPARSAASARVAPMSANGRPPPLGRPPCVADVRRRGRANQRGTRPVASARAWVSGRLDARGGGIAACAAGDRASCFARVTAALVGRRFCDVRASGAVRVSRTWSGGGRRTGALGRAGRPAATGVAARSAAGGADAGAGAGAGATPSAAGSGGSAEPDVAGGNTRSGSRYPCSSAVLRTPR
jgi:hypothetical protein